MPERTAVTPPAVAHGQIESIFRAEYGRAVAVLTRHLGDLDLAQEAVQDAFALAAEKWPVSGLPAAPAGWIITTARRRGIDYLRREATRGDRHAQAALLATASEDAKEATAVPDDQLRL